MVHTKEYSIEYSANAVIDLNEKIRVLHVDDDPAFLKMSKQCLEIDPQLHVETAVSVDEALVKLKMGDYDLIVSDYQMPAKDGLELLRQLRESGDKTPFIMFTGKGMEEVAIEALNLGANQYLNKIGPTETVYTELAHSIREAVKTEKTEEALRNSEEKLRAIVASSPDAITVFDLNGNVTELNGTALRMHGFSKREEILGRSSFDFVAPADLSKARAVFTKTLMEGCVRNAEFSLLTVDGREFPAELSANLVRDRSGTPLYVVASIKDTTERRQAENKLKQSEERFRRIFDSANDYLIYVDSSGKISDANEKAIRAFGGDREDIIGKRFTEFLSPEDAEKFVGLFTESLHEIQRMGSVFEVSLRNMKGELIWLECSQSLISNSDGAVGIVAIARDITDRKNVEQDLTENQEKFAGLFKGNPEATVYTGPDMHIQDINPRFTSLFGYSLNEVRGKHLNDVVVPENLIEEGRMLDRKAVDGYVYHDTVRMRKDGTLIPVSISAAPISTSGRLKGYIGVYKDISEQKNAEKKLAMMNEKLRVIGGLTRHDVRNKLSIIMGNTFLNRKRLTDCPEVVESLEDIDSACNMIVRIFDFAKDYERLGVEELTNIDVGDAVQKAVSLFSDLKEVNLANECRGLTVFADSMLRQLFYNLIDNSLKYGEKTANIRIYYEEFDDHLELFYEDDGVGVSKDLKPKLFGEGFTTGKGSGYGLYLIEKMTEVYGWKIQETGEPGKQAKFMITIPRTNANGKENYHTSQSKSNHQRERDSTLD
jgi:PAS domain S-box-containing protein